MDGGMAMPLANWQREFLATIQAQQAQGWGWRWDSLDDWTTEAIFAQLRELKIDTDAQRFAQQAADTGNYRALKDDWHRQLVEAGTDKEFWPDFPLFAVPVLWRRLAPHVLCADRIEEDLYHVIQAEDDHETLSDVSGMAADVAAVLALARYLQGFPASQRAARFNEVNEGRCYDYLSWLRDWVDERGAEFPDVAMQIVDVMSDCTDAAELQSGLAVALAAAGRKDEAIARAQANINRFPENCWVRILAGDVHEQVDDDATAIGFWLEALPMARDRWDWDGAVERLEAAFDRTGRAPAELSDLLHRYPAPPEPVQPASQRGTYESEPNIADDLFDPMAPIEPIRSGKKIGRNEPCPCGSGKKYKKCCLR
jgi:tetratricopeptide (TPR) repeat protein